MCRLMLKENFAISSELAEDLIRSQKGQCGSSNYFGQLVVNSQKGGKLGVI